MISILSDVPAGEFAPPSNLCKGVKNSSFGSWFYNYTASTVVQINSVISFCLRLTLAPFMHIIVFKITFFNSKKKSVLFVTKAPLR